MPLSPAITTNNTASAFSVLDAVPAINNRLNQLENSRRLDQLQKQLNRLENTVLQENACARATVAEGLPLALIINNTANFSVLARNL